jgi:hypothetical protein
MASRLLEGFNHGDTAKGVVAGVVLDDKSVQVVTDGRWRYNSLPRSREVRPLLETVEL